MPSGQKDHVMHQNHPHEPKEPGEGQHTQQEKEDNVKNHKVEELAKESKGDFRYEDVDEAKKQGRVSSILRSWGIGPHTNLCRKPPTHPRLWLLETRRHQERMRMSAYAPPVYIILNQTDNQG